jgi:hypothetical protein
VNASPTNALGEGLFWMAEKLMWGYDEPPEPSRAIPLYRQAAGLGFSDAVIRLGEAREAGRGLRRDLKAALRLYSEAAKRGNFLAYAYLARLIAYTEHDAKASELWSRFFEHEREFEDCAYVAETPGGLMHSYVEAQVRKGLPVDHISTLRRFRFELFAHHQNLLEHPLPETRADVIDRVQEWLAQHLAD